MTSIRIEAENMTLAGGYQIESGSFASGGKYIGLGSTLGTTGTASRSLQDSFALPSGIYNVTVAYFDETDGQSPLSLSIAGVEKASWIANQSLVGTRAAATNLTTKTIENVQVNSGDEVKLAGSIHSGENARFDFIEFVPVTPPNTDTTAPTASSFTPSDNATGVAVGSNLVVNFNEDIKKGTTGNIVIKKLSDNSVLETISVTASNITVSGSQLTINPTADLAFNTDYYVEIANGAIEDIAGNDYVGITGNSSWNFTTDTNTTPAAEVTIEAESMALTGYRVESGTFASGGAFIGLSSSTGTATKTFDGVSGLYDVTVGYFDENDGVSDFSIAIGENTIRTWKGDKSPGDGRASARNLLTQIISGVNLVNGDEIKLSGVLNSGENGRFDYVKFVPASSAPVDTTAPTASSFTPSDNATGVAVGSNLVVNFNEDIKKGTTGNIVIKKLSDNSVLETISVTASNITVSGSQLTINPTADLAFNTDYYVEIANAAIEDIAGNDYVGITGNSTWNFKTVADTTAPTASSFTPSDNATGVAVGANLVVNFNEDIKKGSSGNIVIKKLSNNSVVETISVTASNITVSGSQLTINPTADLAFNTDYYVEIANGAIEDIAGNDYVGITGNSSWNFKTANNTTPRAKVTIEAENMTLTGYNVELGTFASNGAYIGLTTTNPTGSAIQPFTGQSGVYDINVKYFDESDGASVFSISTGGNTLKQWFGSQSPGDGRATAKNLLTQTIPGVYLNNGDELKLSGVLHSGENARFDSIELVPVSSPTPNTTTPANYSQASKGVYVNLQQNAGYIPNLSQTLKLMPLGDSITAGKEDNSQLKADWVGYRKELWKDFQFFNLPVDFVGSQSNGNFSENQHEGYPGWTISQINGGANNWITAADPDMVLLMIGTNDASSSGSTMAANLETLVNTITAIPKFDNGDLLVSTIAPIHPQSKYYGTRMQNVKDYNALIPGVVNNQPASENVEFVNMWEGLNPLIENDISSPTIDANALHPTKAGYQKMAYHWFDSILNTTQKKDDLTGKNNVIGSTHNDMIFGNASNNNLEGGAGDDEITGGEGADTFVYNNPNHGQDILTDFNPSFGDNFSISATGFGAGLVAGTALSTTASDTGVFVSGTTLNYLGNMPHFFYNTATGVLGFDPDGNKAQPLTSLATLTNKPVLTANQFTIV